jgi:hypothetical protein
VPIVRGARAGEFAVDGIAIRAELDAAKPACLAVETATAGVYVNAWSDDVLGRKVAAPRGPSTLLAEKRGEQVHFHLAENLSPLPEGEP